MPGECVLQKEVAVGGPTRKRRINNVSTPEEDSSSVSTRAMKVFAFFKIDYYPDIRSRKHF